MRVLVRVQLCEIGEHHILGSGDAAVGGTAVADVEEDGGAAGITRRRDVVVDDKAVAIARDIAHVLSAVPVAVIAADDLLVIVRGIGVVDPVGVARDREGVQPRSGRAVLIECAADGVKPLRCRGDRFRHLRRGAVHADKARTGEPFVLLPAGGRVLIEGDLGGCAGGMHDDELIGGDALQLLHRTAAFG